MEEIVRLRERSKGKGQKVKENEIGLPTCIEAEGGKLLRVGNRDGGQIARNKGVKEDRRQRSPRGVEERKKTETALCFKATARTVLSTKRTHKHVSQSLSLAAARYAAVPYVPLHQVV